MIERAASFDIVAELYDRARPPYPEELVDTLVARADLRPGDRVLDVACGTGKLTRPLVDRGLDVPGIELGARLAAVAARNVPEARIVTAPFEEWEPDGTYDVVSCATAWHWLDGTVAAPKVHSLLRQGGALAVIGTHHVFPPDADPFFRAIQPTYASVGEADDEFPAPEEIRHDDAIAIRATGLFDVEDHAWVVPVEYTADSYVDVLGTYSGHITMTAHARTTIFDAVHRLAGDGTITKHYLYCLHLARPRR